MKKLVKVPVKTEVVREVVVESRDEVQDAEGGLMTLLGQRVAFMCVNYIYAGKLVGINQTCVELADAGIVYLTGDWSASSWKDYQKLGTMPVFVQLASIEAFFPTNK